MTSFGRVIEKIAEEIYQLYHIDKDYGDFVNTLNSIIRNELDKQDLIVVDKFRNR